MVQLPGNICSEYVDEKKEPLGGGGGLAEEEDEARYYLVPASQYELRKFVEYAGGI